MIGGKTYKQGFTIVELLIVVVVIAILAAITIVAYNGIQNRSKASAAASSVNQFGKKLALYAQTNASLYPADTTALQSVIGYTLGPDDKYIVDNTLSPAQFCLSITKGTLAQSYASTSSSIDASEGVCVMNYANNPSFETMGTAGTHYNATSSINTSWAASGTRSLQLHSTRTANGEAMRFLQGSFGNMNGIVAGNTYTFSVEMRSLGVFALNDSAQRKIRLRIDGATGGSVSSQLPNSATNQRITTTAVIPTGTIGVMFQADHWGTSSDPDVLIDSVMITEGTTQYAFGDGSSKGWWWIGTPNESRSVGPAKVLN